MCSTIRQIGALTLMLAASGALVPSLAAAQSRPDASTGATLAERLETRATHPNSTASHWLDSGDALVEAAALRAGSDPRAVDDLLGAASAYRVAGALTMARRAALEAARRSARLHDAARTAHAYLAAATLSFDLRDEEGGRTYLERAARHGDSPQVSAADKRLLLAQLLGVRESSGNH